MLVDVWLSAPGPEDAFDSSDQTPLRGLIDTGAEITGLSDEATRLASLVPIGFRDMRGPHGLERNTPMFVAYLGLVLRPPGRASTPEFIHTRIEPVRTQRISSNFQVLLGMDVLAHYRLFMGNGEFKLSAVRRPTPRRPLRR